MSQQYEEKPESQAPEQKHESPMKSKEPEKNAKKVSPSQNNSGGGWISGLFSKIGKPKNQMILPDDKNPSVGIKFLN